MNTQCEPCPLNTWKDDDSTLSCTPVHTCEPGEITVTRPTSSSDRVCQECPDETFATSRTDDAICSDWTECRRADQYEFVSPTSSSDRE